MAKSFYTTGTGNEQTLTPIINEKVPIYDTIADAESDLSNLEVGQIVKTKDAGLVANLNPIDEVKQGVFLPPTSNAVAESLSYSTTEQKTGGKWIDGKDIYRKVWVDKTNAWNSNSNVVGNIPNLDKVVHIEATAVNTSGNCYTNSVYSGMNNIAYVKMSNGDVIYDRQSISDSTNYWKTVIVEYTKNE